MQTEPAAGIFQHLQRFQLGGRERRDNPRVGEAVQTADVVGVPFGVDAGLAIVAGLAFEVDHAGADVLVLALGGLAFAVEVPDWLGEGF